MVLDAAARELDDTVFVRSRGRIDLFSSDVGAVASDVAMNLQMDVARARISTGGFPPSRVLTLYAVGIRLDLPTPQRFSVNSSNSDA